jgi:hypothetical protein
MADTLPVSILLTILMMSFRLIRSPGNKLISNLLLIASGFFVLVFGMIMLVPALPPEKSYPRSYKDYIEEQRFNRIDDVFLYPWKLSNTPLAKTLIVDPAKEDWKFYYYPSVNLSATQAGLELQVEGMLPKKISRETYSRYGMLLSGDAFIRGLFSAFSVFASDIRRLATTRATEFFILSFAFVFFFASSGVLLKITKWPLFNLALMLFVVTGVLFLYAFYQTQVVPELGKYIKSGILTSATPTIVMIIFGLLFSLIDLIFIPSEIWKKDIEGA